VIYWSALSWEAFATLFTGIAAVAGATIVGWRQMRLLHRQIEITHLATDNDRKIRQNELRLKLLERREGVIQIVRDSSAAFQATVDLAGEERKALWGAIQKSEFLFPPSLTDGLSHALISVHRLSAANKVQMNSRRNGDVEKANKWLEKVQEHEEEIFKSLPKLLESMVKIARIEDWEAE